jgi:site-specific DNA-methyltransferase (adenine-specific)
LKLSEIMLETNKLYNADCLDKLKELPDESIDAIISDPPYQLSSTRVYGKDKKYETMTDLVKKGIVKGFMGKEWDVLPSVDILKESLRVLKSGAFALWLMTPRQDSQLEFLSRLKQAGFIIAFTPLYWIYNTGFPKSMNISKAIAKKQGAKKHGAKKHGVRTNNTNSCGVFSHEYQDYELTDEAKVFAGSFAGYQPKPAIELIIVSMKPLSEKTYVEQALKNSKGITWLDNCRIPYTNGIESGWSKTGADGSKGYLNSDTFKIHPVSTEEIIERNAKGRFPANLLVSDNVLDIGKKVTSKSRIGIGGFGAGVNTFGAGMITSERGYNDSGDLSRYFSLDQWWRVHEQELPEEQRKILPFLYCPKASKSERNKGLEDLEEKSKWLSGGVGVGITERENIKARNIHPTVKPIKLLSYLLNLATEKGDIVLDPFIGSGSTAIACILEGRKYIGIEREKEYFEIAKKRIEEAEKQAKP